MATWSDFSNIKTDPNLVECSVAGVRYEGRDVFARQLHVGDRALFDREVGNPHDPYANADRFVICRWFVE